MSSSELFISDELQQQSSGYLSLNPVLATLPGETPSQKALRVFQWLLPFVIRSRQPVALLFSSCHTQSRDIFDTQDRLDSPLKPSQFDESGQGPFYAELVQLINDKAEEIRSMIIELTDRESPIARHVAYRKKLQKIRIIPISTSLRGGFDGEGNVVSYAMIKSELAWLDASINQGYAVFGIPCYQNTPRRFAIGDESSFYFNHSPCFADGSSMASYVERKLNSIMNKTAARIRDSLSLEDFDTSDRDQSLSEQLNEARINNDRSTWSSLKAGIINRILLSTAAGQIDLAKHYAPCLSRHFNLPNVDFWRGQTNACIQVDYILNGSGLCLPSADICAHSLSSV